MNMMKLKTYAVTSLIVGLVSLASLGLSACGNVSRSVAGLTGASKLCVDGVSYLQFRSGATVQVDRTGKPVPCGG